MNYFHFFTAQLRSEDILITFYELASMTMKILQFEMSFQEHAA